MPLQYGPISFGFHCQSGCFYFSKILKFPTAPEVARQMNSKQNLRKNGMNLIKNYRSSYYGPAYKVPSMNSIILTKISKILLFVLYMTEPCQEQGHSILSQGLSFRPVNPVVSGILLVTSGGRMLFFINQQRASRSFQATLGSIELFFLLQVICELFFYYFPLKIFFSKGKYSIQ